MLYWLFDLQNIAKDYFLVDKQTGFRSHSYGWKVWTPFCLDDWSMALYLASSMNDSIFRRRFGFVWYMAQARGARPSLSCNLRSPPNCINRARTLVFPLLVAAWTAVSPFLHRLFFKNKKYRLTKIPPKYETKSQPLHTHWGWHGFLGELWRILCGHWDRRSRGLCGHQSREPPSWCLVLDKWKSEAGQPDIRLPKTTH